MGKLLIVEGEPGTGKSRSIINLDPKTTLVIAPNTKDLPFPGSRKLYSTDAGNLIRLNSIAKIGDVLKKVNDGGKFKTVIIEDITHFFAKRVMQDAAIKGYDKWNEFAYDVFYAILNYEQHLRDDLYIVIIGHVTYQQLPNGEVKYFLQTPGKMLDNTIKIPSHCTYILHTSVDEIEGKIEYRFLTNRDGTSREAKSPEGCLDLFEPNDLRLIIDKIEKYQNGE